MSFEYINKYLDSGIIDRSGMAFWHTVVPGETGNEIIYDSSGNDRHASTANAGETPNNPAVQANVINGKPAIYFDGTDSPLVYTADDFTLQHIFILAKFDGATFTGINGLMSDILTTALLVGQADTDVKFFNLGYTVSGYSYRKNDILYAEDNQLAPMNSWGLMELQFPSGFLSEGIQYGRDRDLSDRRWKGWLVDAMGFSTIRTAVQRARILMYYRLKYALTAMPLVFPHPGILPVHDTGYYSHFREQEQDFDAITVHHEYDDGGRSFNETSDTAPRRWDLEINGVSYAQARIYDEFSYQARKAQTFSFTDKFGETHSGVRVESYSRKHNKNQNWLNDVKFTLVKYP